MIKALTGKEIRTSMEIQNLTKDYKNNEKPEAL